MKNQDLPWLQAPFEVAAMEEFAGQQAASLVLHQQVINGVAAEAHVSKGLTAHDARTNGICSVGLNVLHLRKVNAVFIAKRQIAEQIFERINPALSEQFGTLRANALDHSHFGAEAHRHGLLLYHRGLYCCGKRETCFAALRTHRVWHSYQARVCLSANNGGQSVR